MKNENAINHIHIGSIIKEIATAKGISQKELSKRISCCPSTVTDIFQRKSINTEQLWLISNVLEYNFFTEIYAKILPEIVTENYTFGATTITISKEKIVVEQKNGITTIAEYTKNNDKLMAKQLQ